jgi:peptide/nickel transport system substrate-binding protein
MAKQTSALFRLGRLGTCIAVLGLLFAAGSATATAHPGAKSKYGGSYATPFNDPPDCLDPQKTAAAASNTVDGYILDALLSIDTHGHYVGNLATSYKVSNHGLRLTFKLRHGVKFSNGDSFTATDVKYTFDRALNPATKSPVSASQLSSVAATKVVNKYTVQIDLKTTNRVLLTSLAGAYLGILDHKAPPSCTSVIGTGPYKLKSTGASFSDVTVVANKRHNFAPDWVINHGPPYIHQVSFPVIPSDDTRISDLLTGAVSITDVPGPQLSRVKGNKNIRLHYEPEGNLDFFSFNTKHKPFNNVHVRQAVAMLINRNNIVKAALSGQGKPVYGPLAPAIPLYDKSAKRFMPKFNIKAAAAIIKKYHATGPYNLLIVPVQPFSTIAEIIQAEAAQAGMKINIEAEGNLGAYIAAASAGKFDMNMLNYIYPDPDVLYYLLNSSQEVAGGLNWTNFHDRTLDKLLLEGRTTLKAKRAASIYAQIQARVNKEALFLGIASPTLIIGVRSNIKGFKWNVPAVGWAASDLYISG